MRSVDSDLGELGVKVKKMNVITEATAMVLYHAALQRNGTEAERIFQEAINKFKVIFFPLFSSFVSSDSV